MQAVKGIEIGSGFKSAELEENSHSNFITRKKTLFKSNNAGGTLRRESTSDQI